MKTKSKQEDSYLVRACLSGEKKAVTKLVKKWHLVFCKVAYRYVKDREVAKDIAQDSWRKILNKLEGLQDPQKFESWALSLVKRKAIDYLRSNKRKEEQLKRIADEDRSMTEKEEDVNEDRKALLKKEIEKLNKGQREVIQLYYTQEYSLKEISSILNISVGTAKSRMFHARERLKKVILKSKL
ncbi:RNA polymerase sigma factor [Tenacibaculum xiamenense]|uniref:RNA polymerase sigma factor n=1 Tax=Tenacibaculum xiamenense TaxID=1261553 RepID=UPI003894EC60